MNEMPVLVLNAGSSSLKYQLVVPETAEVQARVSSSGSASRVAQLPIMRRPCIPCKKILRLRVLILMP